MLFQKTSSFLRNGKIESHTHIGYFFRKFDLVKEFYHVLKFRTTKGSVDRKGKRGFLIENSFNCCDCSIINFIKIWIKILIQGQKPKKEVFFQKDNFQKQNGTIPSHGSNPSHTVKILLSCGGSCARDSFYTTGRIVVSRVLVNFWRALQPNYLGNRMCFRIGMCTSNSPRYPRVVFEPPQMNKRQWSSPGIPRILS